ncbi:MAG TPA: hypothetical protein PKG49_12655 [Nitrosomonas mobilis]|nr:hypothetical protein [Nitrosomonas mobilis]
MRTTTKKYVLVFSLFMFLIFGASMNSVASDDVNHEVLANKFESMAAEMNAKITEQQEIFKNKPRTSYFGINGKNIKSHVIYKIRKYEKAAEEYLEQAALHHAMAAEQSDMKSVSTTNKTSGNDDS